MGRKKPAEPGKDLLLFEKVILAAVWLFGTLFMLLVIFRYVINVSPIIKYFKWYAVLLIAAVLLHLLITKLKYPQTTYRIKNYLGKMKSFEQIFVIALFIWFAVVCAVREWIDQASYFKTADWWLLDSAVSALIFFPMAYYFSRVKKGKPLDLMLHIVALAYTVFTAWCLWHIFHLNFLTLPSGNQIGMAKKFRLLLGCNSNITGALAFTILAIACYMMFTQKTVWKIIYGVVAAVQLYTALLSNSRAVYICVLFLGAACGFLLGLNLMKKQKTAPRLAVSCLLAGICVFILWRLHSAAFTLFDSVTNFKVLANSKIASVEDAARSSVSLNGREKIWIASLKTMISSPEAFFFGVTPFNAPNVLHSLGGMKVYPAHAHNIILQVGVSMGVPAMIAFIAFLVKIAINCIRSVWKAKGKDLNRFGMISVIIASLILLNMAESYLVVYYSIMSSVFFLACGSITYTKPAGDLQ